MEIEYEKRVVGLVRAYNKQCTGCKKTQTKVMMSFKDENSEQGQVYDIFLTNQQASYLLKELQEAISFNSEGCLEHEESINSQKG
jgi:hypothetical protein